MGLQIDDQPAKHNGHFWKNINQEGVIFIAIKSERCNRKLFRTLDLQYPVFSFHHKSLVYEIIRVRARNLYDGSILLGIVNPSNHYG